ncbi:MAG: HdeD family acid-resistance protein [Terriglobales bacterium]
MGCQRPGKYNLWAHDAIRKHYEGVMTAMIVESDREQLRRAWGWSLALGIILVVLGVIVLSDTFLATLISMMIVGWLLVVGGIVQIVHAFRTRGWRGTRLAGIAGVLYVVAGLLLVGNPVAGALVLTLMIAFFLFMLGLVRLTSAIALRSPGAAWTIVAGIIDIILAALITAHFPATALWVIGLFLGIEMIVGGLATLLVALEVRLVTAADVNDLRRHMPPAA